MCDVVNRRCPSEQQFVYEHPLVVPKDVPALGFLADHGASGVLSVGFTRLAHYSPLFVKITL